MGDYSFIGNHLALCGVGPGNYEDILEKVPASMACNAMLSILKEKEVRFDFVAAVSDYGLDLAREIARRLGSETEFLLVPEKRKSKKGTVVLIADLATDGEIIKMLERLRKTGSRVACVVCLFSPHPCGCLGDTPMFSVLYPGDIKFPEEKKYEFDNAAYY